MPRTIDHLVIAVKDLEAARSNWQRLGFTVTQPTPQSSGTATAIVQFDGSFIELLAVPDPAAIAKPEIGAFSLEAFNRDFLEKREGISMLALHSADPAADRSAFEVSRLPLFSPCDYEQTVCDPDGTERELAISLTFTNERRLREVGFFTAHRRCPEKFWNSELQRHRNGAHRVSAAVLVTRDPADFHEFLSKFTGQRDMISTSLGVTFALGGGAIEALTPVAYRAWFGEETEADPRRLLGCRIAVADIEATRAVLDDGVPYSERMGALIVPLASANGVAIAFVEDKGPGE